eukprot:TRINITY_DN136580_c0_g1_i1.p1 TRINITY_DN136580_c0_g1~~TRINITY_DN136580_c0_g1_i1.p1  ORF type:complete len:357 (+),score=25.17 TRINITY_DN136580_c0_g1_i1:146-1072(+)
MSSSNKFATSETLVSPKPFLSTVFSSEANLETLLNEPTPPKSKPCFASNLRHLCELFPNIAISTVKILLEDSNGDFDSTFDVLASQAEELSVSPSCTSEVCKLVEPEEFAKDFPPLAVDRGDEYKKICEFFPEIVPEILKNVLKAYGFSGAVAYLKTHFGGYYNGPESSLETVFPPIPVLPPSKRVIHTVASPKESKAGWKKSGPKAKIEEIDLHGLGATDAMNYTKETLDIFADMLRKGEMKRGSDGTFILRIIAGAGNHSANCKPVIRPMVKEYLEKKRYGFKEVQPGVFEVQLQQFDNDLNIIYK